MNAEEVAKFLKENWTLLDERAGMLEGSVN
jgi:hypothetical protein